MSDKDLVTLAKIEAAITDAYAHAIEVDEQFDGKFVLFGDKGSGVETSTFTANEMVFAARNTRVDYQNAPKQGSPDTAATYQPPGFRGQARQLVIYPAFMQPFRGAGVGLMTQGEILFHEWGHGTSAQYAWRKVEDQSVHQESFNRAAREFARGRPYWYPVQ